MHGLAQLFKELTQELQIHFVYCKRSALQGSGMCIKLRGGTFITEEAGKHSLVTVAPAGKISIIHPTLHKPAGNQKEARV